MNTYEVTIAIPIYNAEKYIRQTLDSALAQTFESIEFLILDDGCADSSIGIVHEYQQNHPRGKDIRVVHQLQNMGIGNARNRIIDEAQSKFLYFLDADDTIDPNTITLMWKAAQTHQAQVVLASYVRTETFRERPMMETIQLPSKVFLNEDALAEYAFQSYAALQTSVWNVLMDLSFVRNCNLHFVHANYWEDMVFKYELVTHVSRAVLLPNITYHYICRENSLSNFQSRSEISKSEVLRNVATIDELKQSYTRLIGKSYFANWLTFVLKTDFYIICDVLKKGAFIQPTISKQELQSFLYSPLTLGETWRYGNIMTLLFKFLSIMPPSATVVFVKIFGKLKGLV